MGVKSTIELTRTDAEIRIMEYLLEEMKNRGAFHNMSNKDLEDELERLNDLNHGGEGYENYCITG